MRQCGENHRLFTASEFLPIDLRFEPSVDNTAQIRMRGGKRLSIKGARCSTDTAHLRVTRGPVEQLTATIAQYAEDNGVNSHAIFRDAAEFYSTRHRQAVSDSFARCMRGVRVIPRSERRRDCRSRDR